jgi:ferredoxin
MKAELYYFSGTGNSLYLAKSLAAKLDNAAVKNIKYTDEQEFVSSADIIGIIYPVYAFSMPKMVRAFISKLRVKPTAYVFCIANCASVAGAVLEQSRRMLAARQITLQFGAVLLMPSNYLPFGGAEEESSIMKKNYCAEAKIDEIAAMINNAEHGKIEKKWFFPLWLSTLCFHFFNKGIRKEVKLFWADKKCIFCGTCAKVCPTGNVKLNDNTQRPAWGENCELCLACIQWCPSRAVQWGKISPTRARYHHPDITVGEMKKR